MSLHTPICEMMGIEYPIFAAGMGGVTMAPLTAAISEAGGCGVLGATVVQGVGDVGDAYRSPFGGLEPVGQPTCQRGDAGLGLTGDA